MADLPFTVADVGVSAVLIVSAILAFVRGFIKETLSVVGWVGAIFAVLYVFPLARPLARSVIPLEILADALTAGTIFLVSLAAISIVGYAVAKRVGKSSLNAADRSLGFLFGLLRGAVVICVAYLVLVKFVPVSDHPSWIREARTRPPVEAGANLLVELIPRNGWGSGESAARDGAE